MRNKGLCTKLLWMPMAAGVWLSAQSCSSMALLRASWSLPWQPPSSAHPAPSLSASSCHPHSPQWWRQASTHALPTKEREGRDDQGDWLEPVPTCFQGCPSTGSRVMAEKGSRRWKSPGRAVRTPTFELETPKHNWVPFAKISIGE